MVGHYITEKYVQLMVPRNQLQNGTHYRAAANIPLKTLTEGLLYL